MAVHTQESFKAAMKIQIEPEEEEYKGLFKSEDEIKDLETPLHRAVKDNNSEIVKLIADYSEEDFNDIVLIQNCNQQTPFHIAFENNNLEIMKLMASTDSEAF